MEEISELIAKLQQLDNPKGYRMEYESVKERLDPVVKQLAQEGEAALDQLHELLQYEESWSCQFALEALKGIKSEKSISHLIKFVKRTENGDYYEGCDEAIWALEAIGEPAVEPLLTELKKGFADKEFYGYLVEALTGIKDDRVYSFMVETTEDYLKNPGKYDDWFEVDAFACGFGDQGKKDALPLLRKLLAMKQLDKDEKKEISSVIEELDDLEGYEKRIQEMINNYELETEATEEAIKVNCDFCSSEMECPPHMLKSKQMCHKCFHKRIEEGGDKNGPLDDVHVDIPTDELITETANSMTNSMVEELFPEIWTERKDELKELSKNELALEMFGAGAYIALSNVLKIQHMQGLKNDGKRKTETD
ncbi:hypothetical protein HYU12_01770 [Candidatus Woesearchaeota archaeon]|nr:hypothetical protein [Candidatus Woesearchaeota archaeon]